MVQLLTFEQPQAQRGTPVAEEDFFVGAGMSGMAIDPAVMG